MDLLPADRRTMRIAAVVFLAGFVLHNADHFRRGVDTITWEVLWAGTATGIMTLLAIGLALAGHRLSPLLAVLVGFSMAVGVSAVHLTPHWSALSDSLPDGPVDGFTWAAVLAEVAGAFVFGAAGARVLGRSAATQPA
jgi:hypothetical protein